jgi:chromate transport protein ChrA
MLEALGTCKARAYLITLVTDLIAAAGIAILLNALGVTEVVNGILVALLMALIVIVSELKYNLYSGRH